MFFTLGDPDQEASSPTRLNIVLRQERSSPQITLRDKSFSTSKEKSTITFEDSGIAASASNLDSPQVAKLHMAKTKVTKYASSGNLYEPANPTHLDYYGLPGNLKRFYY